ncbi:MAG: aquaporin [Rhizomicrobium sp.]
MADLRRACFAEALGTCLLVAGVVGSGIMVETLTRDAALALLCNTAATAALLVVLILALAPVSGAHLNPAVTLAFAVRGEFAWRTAAAYMVAQFAAALPAPGSRMRCSPYPFSRWASPRAAVRRSGCRSSWRPSACCSRSSPRGGERVVAFAVGLYVAAAYWFTASTAFANPAVTVARALTPTFSGIRPADAPAFVVAEIAGALTATFVSVWLFAGPKASPHA